MNLTPANRAASAILTDRLESRRKAQRVLFQARLADIADVDTELFATYALYVLPPQLWTLVEDLKRTEDRLSEKKIGVRLTDQLEYLHSSLIKSIISAMIFRESGDEYPVKLLEVMTDAWRQIYGVDSDNPLETGSL